MQQVMTWKVGKILFIQVPVHHNTEYPSLMDVIMTGMLLTIVAVLEVGEIVADLKIVSPLHFQLQVGEGACRPMEEGFLGQVMGVLTHFPLKKKALEETIQISNQEKATGYAQNLHVEISTLQRDSNVTVATSLAGTWHLLVWVLVVTKQGFKYHGLTHVSWVALQWDVVWEEEQVALDDHLLPGAEVALEHLIESHLLDQVNSHLLISVL
jgi:hypothetical protein